MKKRLFVLLTLLIVFTMGCAAQTETSVSEDDNTEIAEETEENEEESTENGAEANTATDEEDAAADISDEAESDVTEESTSDATEDATENTTESAIEDATADTAENVTEDTTVTDDTAETTDGNSSGGAENAGTTETFVEEVVVEEPASGPQNYIAEYRVEEGYLAPDFSATLIDGSVVNLSDYQGTPVILNFWATWCGPCCNEMPAFQQLANEYGSGLTILAVNCGESATAVQSFAAAYGYTFPMALDTNYAISSLYPTNGIPYTIVIDEYGVIRHITVGASTAEQMYNHYKECLQNL